VSGARVATAPEEKIWRLRRRGLSARVQDEAFAVHDAAAGTKYWSPVGVPASVLYMGSHYRMVVYGSLTEGGKRLSGRTNGPTPPRSCRACWSSAAGSSGSQSSRAGHRSTTFVRSGTFARLRWRGGVGRAPRQVALPERRQGGAASRTAGF